MKKNESGAIETGPTDRRTATRRTGDGDTTAQRPAEKTRGCPDPAPSSVEYRFSTHKSTSKYAPINPADVDRVYAAVRELLDGRLSYFDAGDISLGPTNASISRALGLLAEDDRCPLDIQRWSGPSANRTTWRVERPEGSREVAHVQ